jgi:hypothetical protein
MTTFTESHDLAPPRMVLTTHAVDWATGALSWDDTTVSALARQLGVDCVGQPVMNGVRIPRNGSSAACSTPSTNRSGWALSQAL